jgi:hypothetical protein
MVCTTIKPGLNCVFMSKAGCSFNGGRCHPIVEGCEGCGRTVEFSGGKYCASYPDPGLKWKSGRCNFATHIKDEVKAKAFLNPLKASKRGVK